MRCVPPGPLLPVQTLGVLAMAELLLRSPGRAVWV